MSRMLVSFGTPRLCGCRHICPILCRHDSGPWIRLLNTQPRPRLRTTVPFQPTWRWSSVSLPTCNHGMTWCTVPSAVNKPECSYVKDDASDGSPYWTIELLGGKHENPHVNAYIYVTFHVSDASICACSADAITDAATDATTNIATSVSIGPLWLPSGLCRMSVRAYVNNVCDVVLVTAC